jgi:hypothetical protein
VLESQSAVLKWTLHSAFLLACDACLLQIEFALNPATGPADTQELVDIFPFDSD